MHNHFNRFHFHITAHRYVVEFAIILSKRKIFCFTISVKFLMHFRATLVQKLGNFFSRQFKIKCIKSTIDYRLLLVPVIKLNIHHSPRLSPFLATAVYVTIFAKQRIYRDSKGIEKKYMSTFIAASFVIKKINAFLKLSKKYSNLNT